MRPTHKSTKALRPSDDEPRKWVAWLGGAAFIGLTVCVVGLAHWHSTGDGFASLPTDIPVGVTAGVR